MQVDISSTKGVTIATPYTILFVCFVSLSVQVFADDVYGTATTTVGGTVRVAGTRVNLHGIFLPVPGQSCIADNVEWDCGRAAIQALADRVGATPIRCVEQSHNDVDGITAVCYLDNVDINGWLVSEGWALASYPFTLAYLEGEQAARFAKKGIWRGGFNAPPSWKRQQQGAPANEDAMDCSVCTQRHRSILRSRASDNSAD